MRRRLQYKNEGETKQIKIWSKNISFLPLCYMFIWIQNTRESWGVAPLFSQIKAVNLRIQVPPQSTKYKIPSLPRAQSKLVTILSCESEHYKLAAQGRIIFLTKFRFGIGCMVNSAAVFYMSWNKIDLNWVDWHVKVEKQWRLSCLKSESSHYIIASMYNTKTIIITISSIQ